MMNLPGGYAVTDVFHAANVKRACPEGAVSIVNNHAVIDYDKCVGCVACTVKCRKKIIVDTLHDLTKVKEKVAFCKMQRRI